MSNQAKVISALTLAVVAAFLWVGWLTDWSFDLSDVEQVSEDRARKAHADCILTNMKGTADRLAARAVLDACSEKHLVKSEDWKALFEEAK
jgi:hypothetical protein